MNQPSAKRGSTPTQLAYQTVEQQFVLATYREVGIAVWVDEPPVEAIQQAQHMLEQLSLDRPEGIAFLQVIGEDSQNFEAPARTALRQLLRACSRSLRDAPVVYEGSGFRAAAMRAIVTGLLSARSYGFSHRVYSSVDEAALAIGRVFEKREPSRYARELCDVLASIRERHLHEFPTASHSFIRYKR